MHVTIVGGGGGVGSSVAYNLLRSDLAPGVVIVDRCAHMVTSHVMDLEQTLPQGAGRSIRGGDLRDLATADVVVLCAAVPLTINRSRHVHLNDNAAIVGAALDELPAGWPGVVLVVTNPVDPLVTWIQRRTGLDRRRVVGYTLNDSLRLRTALAEQLGASPSSVEAWVIGEHGDACVALWDRIRVDGVAVELDAAQRAAAERFLRTWYVRHVALDSGRSSTWTSGLGITRMIEALAAGDDEPWPASLVLEGEYGHAGVALSVPVTLGPGGVRAVHDWALTDEQSAQLDRAAAVVRAATATIDAERATA